MNAPSCVTQLMSHDIMTSWSPSVIPNTSIYSDLGMCLLSASCCFYQISYITPEDGGETFTRKVDELPTDYTRRMLSSSMLRRVALVRTDVLEGRIAIIGVKRIDELGTTLTVY
jgi:hypothetical protein